MASLVAASAPAAAQEKTSQEQPSQEQPSQEQPSSEHADSRLRDVHLPGGVFQLQVGLGGQFHQSYGELTGDAVVRWGVTDRLNVALPLMGSFLADESDSHRIVVMGGLQGIGFRLDGGVATTLSLAGAYEHLPSPDTVWSVITRATHERNWSSLGSGLSMSVSVNRGQTLDDRWMVAGGLSALHFSRTSSLLQLDNDTSIITVGASGGSRRPLVQYRVWQDFNLYASSRLKLVWGDAFSTIHEHVGGFNWFF